MSQAELDKKLVIVILIIGLTIGVNIGYFISPRGIDPAVYEQSIDELKSQIDEKDTDISELTSQKERLQSDILILQNQTAEKDASIAELTSLLQEANITEFLLNINQLEGEIKDLSVQIELKDTNIEDLSVQIELKDTNIEDLSAQIELKDAHLNTLQVNTTLLQYQLNMKDIEISILNSEIASLEQEIEGLNNQISDLEANIEELSGFLLLDVSFSGTEDTHGKIVQWIFKSNTAIHLMTPIITADNPADALIEAHNRDIEVSVIVDDDGKQGTESDYQRILDAGVDIRSDNNVAQMNHSIMIIDGQIVIVGSNLWSEPAEGDNYSVIIIRSNSVSTLYMEEFNRIWEHTLPGT